MKRSRSEAEIRESAKARGLMQVIERIIARHYLGKCRLDEETFKLFEVAKRIKQANNNQEFLAAIDQLEIPRNSWLPEDRG